MKTNTLSTSQIVSALAALGQESRLAIFRLLVQAGQTGCTPSQLAESLNMPAATLSFHIKTLTAAGLIHPEQLGRSITYRAEYENMQSILHYLTDNCCGKPAHCQDLCC